MPHAADERRSAARHACHAVLIDSQGRELRAVNLSHTGIRYLTSVPPDKATAREQRLSMALPNSEHRLELLVRPVWQKQSASSTWEVGAAMEARQTGQLRLHYLLHALSDHHPHDEIWWVPLRLLDEAIDPEALVARIRTLEPGPVVARAARVGNRVSQRPWYLWQWAKEAIRLTTFSSVAPELRETVETLKLCAAIFFTAVDDITDELQDAQFFSRLFRSLLRGTPISDGSTATDRRLRYLLAMWRQLLKASERLPRHLELRDCFDFDYVTILHGQAHSLLVNRLPEIACDAEERCWTVNSFFMLVFADLDLMCSPDFDRRELGAVREIVHEAQAMWAITNWLGTWEREVHVGDFTSGVVGAALRRRLLCAEDLTRAEAPRLVERIRRSGIEASLLSRWEGHWHAFNRKRALVSSIDMAAHLRGVEELFQMQLASRGLI